MALQASVRSNLYKDSVALMRIAEEVRAATVGACTLRWHRSQPGDSGAGRIVRDACAQRVPPI